MSPLYLSTHFYICMHMNICKYVFICYKYILNTCIFCIFSETFNYTVFYIGFIQLLKMLNKTIPTPNVFDSVWYPLYPILLGCYSSYLLFMVSFSKVSLISGNINSCLNTFIIKLTYVKLTKYPK